jgi:hypothetical protein
MRANLKRIKLLFKAKTQPANNSSAQRGDERHNTEVDGRMYSREIKVADLIEEYLQTKEKNQNERGR